jgi:hypothetical protein
MSSADTYKYIYGSAEAEVRHDEGNTLSHFFLESNMLTPWVNMGSADHIRRLYKDTSSLEPEAYRYIAINTPFIALFDAAIRCVPEGAIDFDRNGILYEHGDVFFTVLEALPEDEMGATKKTIRCGWLTNELLGPYLQQEWQSLPKIRIGAKGSAAYDLDESRWHVHSMAIQRLREAIAGEAQEINSKRSTSHPRLSEDLYTKTLEFSFGRIVETYYRSIRIREEQAAKEAQSAIDEFLMPDEEK